jgi:membrane protease YdiL (CAAX protease family)
MPPVLIGIFCLFAFVYALVIMTIFGIVGNVFGDIFYIYISSLGMIKGNAFEARPVIFASARLLMTSLGLVMLPVLDRTWTRYVIFAFRDVGALRSTAWACLGLASYAFLVLHLLPSADKASMKAHNISLWVEVLFAVALALIVPFAEEVFFRGWMWGRLEISAGVHRAAILTAAAWLALHLPNMKHVLSLLPLACLLTLLRLKTRNLLFVIMLHALYNFSVFIYYVVRFT